MSRAVLTIDDAPTKITPKIIDYLQSKDIVPVFNFMGCKIDEYFEEAVYAVKSGITIGNHSFSHPHFSSISLKECRDEIRKTEQEIDRVYAFAGMERQHRVFRFPYGDNGGEQAALIQRMLKEDFHFEKLDDSEIKLPFWKEEHIDQAIDMKWTFDFVEYQMAWENDFTWDTIMNHIHDKNPEMGGCLLGDKNTMNIILMHDMEETEAFMEKYYEKLIDYILSCGVEFVKPKFISFEK